MKPLGAALAAAAVALGAPAASAATLTVDPAQPCYREQEGVMLQAEGFTPNALVDFARGGSSLGQVSADASGALQAKLDLPGLPSGQAQLTYVATDMATAAVSAQVSLLVTATDVAVAPTHGVPNRLLRISGRGFFGGKWLWAHIRRTGRRGSPVRTVRIGRIDGACREVSARKRLFRAATAPGTYPIQFDPFRTFKADRRVKSDFIVTIARVTRPGRGGTALGVRPLSARARGPAP